MKEEVRASAPASWSSTSTPARATGSGAYASAMSDEALAKQRELMTKTVAASDVVITTAQVQGAKAPVLVTRRWSTRWRRAR